MTTGNIYTDLKIVAATVMTTTWCGVVMGVVVGFDYNRMFTVDYRKEMMKKSVINWSFAGLSAGLISASILLLDSFNKHVRSQ
jgi:hypothetical protein